MAENQNSRSSPAREQVTEATKLHGPFGWLNGCRGLNEESWTLESDPLENSDEYFAIPLYALSDPFKEIGAFYRPPAAALTHPSPGDLLDKLAEHTNLELSWGAHPDDDTEACWQVHRVNGGRNDREWTLVGVGNTPREALYAALPAAPGLTKLQEGE